MKWSGPLPSLDFHRYRNDTLHHWGFHLTTYVLALNQWRFTLLFGPWELTWELTWPERSRP